MADLPAWLFAAICLSGFLLFAGYNSFMAWSVYVKSEHAQSIGPVFGGLIGFVGLLIAPVGEWTDRLAYAWIPLLLDFGCVPYLAVLFWDMARNRRTDKEMTLEKYRQMRRSQKLEKGELSDE